MEVLIKASFLIPATTGLSLLSGCHIFGDPLLGAWSLVEINGEPNTYTYEEHGATCTYAYNITLKIDKRRDDTLWGEAIFDYTARCDDEYVNLNYTLAIPHITVEGERSYLLTLGTDEEMPCTLLSDGEDHLRCDAGDLLLFIRGDHP